MHRVSAVLRGPGLQVGQTREGAGGSSGPAGGVWGPVCLEEVHMLRKKSWVLFGTRWGGRVCEEFSLVL